MAIAFRKMHGLGNDFVVVDARNAPLTLSQAAAAAIAPRDTVFLDLPEMTVNLSSAEQRSQYLKVSISLEVADKETVAMIEPVMPRVLDAFQVYLREMRITDLEGSAGLFRLKEDLARRVNLAIYPAEVESVLFKQILIQ